MTNALLATRSTLFLQTRRLLVGESVPARVNKLIRAWREFDPKGFGLAEALAGGRAGRKRWAILKTMCDRHGVNLARDRDADQRNQDNINRMRLRDKRRPGYVASDAFLDSFEWRRVRMQVLIRDGRRCACCGATPDDGLRMHVDHIKPRIKYPHLALDMNNLQVLCEVCNHGKGAWDQTDWRKERPAANEPLTDEQRQHIREIAEG